jgi:hypothetical protein
MAISDSSTTSRSRAPFPQPRHRSSDPSAQLTEDVTGRVNAGSLDLVAGNALLAAAGLAPLEPGIPADFLVPICLHVHDHAPSTIVARAKRLLSDDLDELTWTRLAEPPRYWHVDRDQAAGSGYATVHTELRLRVTALASPAGQQGPTAFRLLTRDLRLLSEVDVFPAGIRAPADRQPERSKPGSREADAQLTG